MEQLVCRYCGSADLAPSFIKRRDARCRACFKQRYGSTARQQEDHAHSQDESRKLTSRRGMNRNGAELVDERPGPAFLGDIVLHGRWKVRLCGKIADQCECETAGGYSRKTSLEVDGGLGRSGHRCETEERSVKTLINGVIAAIEPQADEIIPRAPLGRRHSYRLLFLRLTCPICSDDIQKK